jgi:hypothetical protein
VEEQGGYITDLIRLTSKKQQLKTAEGNEKFVNQRFLTAKQKERVLERTRARKNQRDIRSREID